MLPDFPDWFHDFLDEQLKEFPDFAEHETSRKDDLMLSYLKLWGVIEAFSKIIVRLYQKRTNLIEIKAQLKEAECHKESMSEWEESLSVLITQYAENINTGTVSITADNIVKKTINLKAIKATKFSVEKRDIALMKLPSKENFEKACSFLEINQKGVLGLLKPKGGESVFYNTRNSIAHEGKLDIAFKNFVTIRINPVKEAVSEIKCIRGLGLTEELPVFVSQNQIHNEGSNHEV